MHFTASPEAGLPRRWWPVAVSLVVHVLLIGLWLRHSDLRPVAPERPEPLTVLVLPAPVALPSPPQPKPAERKKPDEKHARPSAPVALPPLAATPNVPPQPSVSPEPQAASTPHPSTADILDSARRDIGKLSREASGGKLGGKPGGELRARDSAWDRFGQRVADAKIDHSPAPNREAYTSPDGLTYYRTRVGDHYECRKTGTLDPSSTWKNGREMQANSMSTLGMGGTSGLVLCPGSERDWKQQ
jgi:hypothetical protein